MVNIEEYIMMQSPVPKPYYTYASAGDGIFFKTPVDAHETPIIKLKTVYDWYLTRNANKIYSLKKVPRVYVETNADEEIKTPKLVIVEPDDITRELKLTPLALQALEMYEKGTMPAPTLDDINKLNNEWLYYYKNRTDLLKGLTIKDTTRGLQIVPVIPEEPKKKQKKFYIGEKYQLRLNNLDGSPAMEYHFTCKKFINEIAGSEVNVLIMKRLGVYRYSSNERIFVDNSDSLIYTLNKNDCKMYHIKYEPGLEVWPMSMKWIACNRDNENDNDRTI